MANNELLARAEASPTPWLPPQPGLFTSAYDTSTNLAPATAGNAAITQAQGTAAIAQPPTLTSDQTAMLFSNLGQEDMAKFFQALPAADQQTLTAAVSQPNLTLQVLSQAFSQIPAGDIQTALAALPAADLQTALAAAANPANPATTQGDAGTGAVTPVAYTAPDATTPTYSYSAPVTGDTTATATNPQLSPAQMALVFTQLPAQDMTALVSALPAADQTLLNPALTNPNATLADLVQAFSQVPQADLTAAFAQVPGADLQTAITAAANLQQPTQVADAGTTAVTTNVPTPDATNQPVPQSGQASNGSDLSTQLANLTPDQITKILDALPQQDATAFMNALPAADQQALTQAVSGQTLNDQLLTQALNALPHQDVMSALGQVPTADLQKAFQEVTQINPAAKNGTTDAPPATEVDAPAGQSGSGTNWVKWGAASLVAGGGGYYAYKKFDLGTKLADLKAGGFPDSLSGLAARFRGGPSPIGGAGGAAIVPDSAAVVPNVAQDLTGAVVDTSKLAAVVPGGLETVAKTGIGETLERVAASGSGEILASTAEKGGAEVVAEVLTDAAKVAV